MNVEIIVGFLEEHSDRCLRVTVSQFYEGRIKCAFCNNINRDLSLLITRIQEARKTVDVGLALPHYADIITYMPYKSAGFEIFSQIPGTETEKIKIFFQQAFERGYQRVIALSHGVPNLPIDYLEGGLKSLREKTELVVGPLENGMFYLIGLTKQGFQKIVDTPIFKDISFVNIKMRDSLINMIKSFALQYTILPEWYLLKSLEDLKKLYRDCLQGIGFKAQWTRNFAHDLLC